MTKNDLLDLIGRNLRKYRKKLNLTQADVADRANISVSFYSALENGRKTMSILVLFQIADVFEVSYDSLLREAGSEHQIKNIDLLLADQPAEIVDAVESLATLFIQTLSRSNK